MASVHRQSRSPYWTAHFRLPLGKAADGRTIWRQVKRTTGKVKKDEAMVEAKRMEKLELDALGSKHGSTEAILTSLRNAAAMAVKGKLTQNVARDILSEINSAATGQPLETYTVESWLSLWIENKSGSRSQGTAKRYQGIVQSFLQFLGNTRSDDPLESLTQGDILAFRTAEIKAGKSVGSSNLALKTIRTALRSAWKYGLIKTNPAEAVETLSADTIEKGTFSFEQIQQMMRFSKDDWPGAILVGYYTGARLGDVVNLKISSVQLPSDTILFYAQKSKKWISIPLHPSLKPVLTRAMSKKRGDDFIFPNLAGKMASGRNGLSGQFSRIMKAAGIKSASVPAKGDAGRTRNALSFHSLRHSFNSHLANAGVSQEVRMKLTGHSSKKVNAGYTHADFEILKMAVAKLANLSPIPMSQSGVE